MSFLFPEECNLSVLLKVSQKTVSKATRFTVMPGASDTTSESWGTPLKRAWGPRLGPVEHFLSVIWRQKDWLVKFAENPKLGRWLRPEWWNWGSKSSQQAGGGAASSETGFRKDMWTESHLPYCRSWNSWMGVVMRKTCGVPGSRSSAQTHTLPRLLKDMRSREVAGWIQAAGRGVTGLEESGWTWRWSENSCQDGGRLRAFQWEEGRGASLPGEARMWRFNSSFQIVSFPM